jgi:RNA polymerase sigma-70 factor (family 1)
MLASVEHTIMTLHELSDNELLNRLRAGDQDAFAAIYDRHWSGLYKTALNILDDGDLAKDILQETFLSFFEKATHTTIVNLKAYLFQTAKYRCFMHLRSGRITEKHLKALDTVIASNVLEEEFNASELQGVLDQSIARLPKKCREVFYLSRYEALSNKKIAQRLNISPKTVENQMTKALRILQTSIDKLVVLPLVLLSHLL